MMLDLPEVFALILGEREITRRIARFAFICRWRLIGRFLCLQV
jgi:hypothetical protein